MVYIHSESSKIRFKINFFLIIFSSSSNWRGGGVVETPIGKFQLDFFLDFKPFLIKPWLPFFLTEFPNFLTDFSHFLSDFSNFLNDFHNFLNDFINFLSELPNFLTEFLIS